MFEKGYSRFVCERELETEQKLQYFDPNSIGHNCVSFPFSWAAQPRAWGPLCWVLAFSTTSCHQRVWPPNSIGVPDGPFGRVWLSLPLLVYLPLQLYCNSTGTWLPSWLRYIIIQRPHDRPLHLWNRMFNPHQAEITVMQFIGHSLPVHQSMSVPWEFFSSSHFISQFPPTRFPLITAIRMCHLLPVHHLGMAFLAGSKGRNITISKRTRNYLPRFHWTDLQDNSD